MGVGRGGYLSQRNMGRKNFNIIIIVTLYYYRHIVIIAFYISLLNYICTA